MILSIQYLRFIAALMVVIFHATQSLHRDFGSDAIPSFPQGARGVDIFFVISGFIIVHVSQNATYGGREFLYRRFSRVAPPYYLASAVMLAVAITAPQVLKSTSLTLPHTVASLLFIPWDNPTTAGTFPLLQVGWTLNAEMQFYAIFSLVFFLPIFYRTIAASCIILSIVLIGLTWTSENSTLSAWTDTILLEFILGMTLAITWRNGFIGGGAVLGWSIVGVGSILLLGLPAGSDGLGKPFRFLISGVPAAIIIAGLLIVEKARPIREVTLLRLLGDASYALYIWHFFVLGAVRVFWRYTDFQGIANDIIFICSVVVISVSMSVFFYLWLERPLVAFATWCFLGRRNGKQTNHAA